VSPIGASASKVIFRGGVSLIPRDWAQQTQASAGLPENQFALGAEFDAEGLPAVSTVPGPGRRSSRSLPIISGAEDRKFRVCVRPVCPARAGRCSPQPAPWLRQSPDTTGLGIKSSRRPRVPRAVAAKFLFYSFFRGTTIRSWRMVRPAQVRGKPLSRWRETSKVAQPNLG